MHALALAGCLVVVSVASELLDEGAAVADVLTLVVIAAAAAVAVAAILDEDAAVIDVLALVTPQ